MKYTVSPDPTNIFEIAALIPPLLVAAIKPLIAAVHPAMRSTGSRMVMHVPWPFSLSISNLPP